MTVERARQALVTEVGRATQAYQRATDTFDDEVGRVLDLNPTDLRCLDWLTERPMSAGELAAATGLSSAATTTLVDRLERKGLTRRVGDPGDRRKVLVELTPEAGDVLGRLYGPLARDGERLLAGFSEEELARLRDFLVAATSLVAEHTGRLRRRDGQRVRAAAKPGELSPAPRSPRGTARPYRRAPGGCPPRT